MWEYVLGALVAALGIVFWFLNNRAKTKLEKQKEEVRLEVQKLSDAVGRGDPLAIRRALDRMRRNAKP